uniref:NADH-ubiquinone oxidoreductase chain 4L n=1 Tax=Phryganea bipunctata TaxID=1875852 RepID=A0A7D7FSS1_9NEOP|nr:NADH dehydrogenase subunit 4L [Phryganea bipunctata]QMP96680.1 NADH dehydrogenase subunit 4L [Phryganea bipunctata]
MKMMHLMNFIMMNYLIGNFMYSLNRKHLLIILLSLEFIMLNLFFMIYVYTVSLGNSMYFMVMFMVLSVCEGVLGISILMYMIRIFGNDYVRIFSVL